jgi:hypothetical protein
MPFENPQACEMLERRNANPPGYPLSLRTKEMYKHLWMLIMQCEVNSREVNHRLTTSSDVMEYDRTDPTPEVKRNLHNQYAIHYNGQFNTITSPSRDSWHSTKEAR